MWGQRGQEETVWGGGGHGMRSMPHATGLRLYCMSPPPPLLPLSLSNEGTKAKIIIKKWGTLVWLYVSAWTHTHAVVYFTLVHMLRINCVLIAVEHTLLPPVNRAMFAENVRALLFWEITQPFYWKSNTFVRLFQSFISSVGTTGMMAECHTLYGMCVFVPSHFWGISMTNWRRQSKLDQKDITIIPV